LRVFGNRVLWRIFGPKREEVAEGQRRLHSEELHNLHASPNIVRDDQVEDEMGEASSMHEKGEKYIQDLLETLIGRDHSKDISVDWEDILG
jgi:hypothetical protein